MYALLIFFLYVLCIFLFFVIVISFLSFLASGANVPLILSLALVVYVFFDFPDVVTIRYFIQVDDYFFFVRRYVPHTNVIKSG